VSALQAGPRRLPPASAAEDEANRQASEQWRLQHEQPQQQPRSRDDATFTPSFADCSATSPVGKAPMCNPALGWEARMADLLSRMTVEEKISWLGTTSPAIPRLGLPAYEWWSEALHGVANSPGVEWGGSIPWATSFPEPLGLAASFDRRLVREVAATISTEARAMNNAGQAGITFFTPNINLFRDPRWGRGQETPGEDPYLASQYTYALIQGLQGGEDPRYLKIVADCKHFAAYDLEDSAGEGTDRFHFDAKVSDQDMVESYLPAFETCVRDAQAASVMCSYNSVNSVPSCANDYLLQTLLRDEWNLQGFVVSDCDAVEDIYTSHHYTSSLAEASAAAIKAGNELNCGRTMQNHTGAALAAGLVTEQDIDQALTRSIGTLMRTGFFDAASGQPYRQLSAKDVNTPAAQALALQAARAGMTLLKNTASPVATAMTLPYNVKVQTPTLALIGPFANQTLVQAGNYYGEVSSPLFTTPLETLTKAGFKVTYVQGCEVDGNDTSGFAAAIAVATHSWYTLFVGGIDGSLEQEGKDRPDISLPLIQTKLLQALAENMVGPANKPLTAAFYGGGPVDYSPVLALQAVGAVLWMGYGGQGAGQALADVVSGAVSPAGRLVTTIYPADYVNKVRMTDMSFRPSPSNPGRTYKFFPPQQAVLEFGTGLSYSRFQYAWFPATEEGSPAGPRVVLKEEDCAHEHVVATDSDTGSKSELEGLAVQQVRIDELALVHAKERTHSALQWRVNVTNVGVWVSDVVVLLFASPATPDPSLPLKELVAFERVYALAPFETRTVNLAVQARQLAEVDAKGKRWLRAGKRIVLGVDVPTKPMHMLELVGEDTQLL
jgi:beta-D-xylosidase 4